MSNKQGSNTFFIPCQGKKWKSAVLGIFVCLKMQKVPKKAVKKPDHIDPAHQTAKAVSSIINTIIPQERKCNRRQPAELLHENKRNKRNLKISLDK